MKRGWLASLVAAALVLPMAARGADETKTPEPTPTVKTPGTAPDTTKPRKAAKGRLPPYYGKLPVTDEQRAKIYAIEGSFSPRIQDLRDQIDALEGQRDEQIKALLTPEQLDKLKAMMAEAKAKRTGKATTDASSKSTDSKTPDSKVPDTKSTVSPKPEAPTPATPAPK
jgi:Spy/CpxP family protein refolding chaperone